MIGAIAGDVIGAVHENFRTKRKDFTLFTRVIVRLPDSRGYPVTARLMTEKEKRRFEQWRNR
jgi:hypothetical protein